jgi:HTH-type transcriptional regulator/antitoxin HigA
MMLTEAEYNRLVAMLDQLIDEVGEDEAHPLASFMDIIGVLIEHYENVNVPSLSRRRRRRPGEEETYER